MRLVYFGSGAFGIPTLASLSKSHDLALIVTQPDRPAGRGGALSPTPIATWAAAHLPSVPILKPERASEPAMAAQIRGVAADAWVVIAFGQKLTRSLLEGVFAINLHASLLPRWRGAGPINAAILAGDTQTGNSVITLADRMDAGMILEQSHRDLDPMLTAGELHDILSQDGPALVETVLAERSADRLHPVPQDESLVSMAPKLSKSDGWLDFGQTAEECQRRIHGLTPWPGVTVSFRGQPLKLLRGRPEQMRHDAPVGAIVDADHGIVACGRSTSLALLEVQAPGKRAMSWADYARGQRPTAGEHLRGRDGADG